MSDFIIEHDRLPHEFTSKVTPLDNETIPSEHLETAYEWLTKISLPQENPFSSMSDDDIRQARLIERGYIDAKL